MSKEIDSLRNGIQKIVCLHGAKYSLKHGKAYRGWAKTFSKTCAFLENTIGSSVLKLELLIPFIHKAIKKDIYTYDCTSK